MRLILILLASGVALLGCDAPDRSTESPEPEAPEPAAPEPERQPVEPDVIEPDPEPEPDFGPAPASGDGVFHGVGTLLVQVSGDNAFDMGGTVVVTPMTADGDRLPSLSAPMDQYPVERDWRVQRWWPVDPAAPDAITQAEVEVRDGERVLSTRIIAIAELPVVETGCDPNGFANRCAPGATCFAPSTDVGGRCDPVSVDIWGHAERMHFDLRADRGSQADIAQTTIGRAGNAERVVLQHVDAPGWRAVGSLWRQDTDPAEFAVFIGPHRVGHASIQVPPTRAPHDPCDVLRLADACADGTACSDRGVCVGITAPIVTQAEFIERDGQVGIWLVGVDPDGDAERLIVHGDGDETEVRLETYSAHTPQSQGGIQLGADGQFEAVWLARGDRRPTGVHAVQVMDAEGLRSPIMRLTALAAPVEGAKDGVCDDAGVVVTCPDATACDLRDGDRQFTCQSLAPGCAAPDRFEPFVGEVMAGVNAGIDATTNSCHRSRGNLGEEAGFIITAERAGVHTVTARSEGYGVLGSMAVRRVCHLSGATTSELGCARDMSQGNGAPSLTVEVELEAGETVYVVVESHWVGGGGFELTLGRP